MNAGPKASLYEYNYEYYYYYPLGQVKKRYGKRVVVIVSELDSGRERQLTPEDYAPL
jgi:hypothetical protein